LLTDGCASEKTKIGRKSNTEVVTLAAPVAFDRVTQVIDLSPRRFPFGIERRAPFRIPFFFVEAKIVHAYFLQPRKSASPTFDEMGMIAAIFKQHLLDTEFFGLKTDIEFVDVGVSPGESERSLKVYRLSDLSVWDNGRVGKRLTMIGEALDIIEKDVALTRRPKARIVPDPEMPLFD